VNCKICNNQITEKGAVLAVPTIVSWRKSGDLAALAFLPWNDKLSKRPKATPLCGMVCAHTANDRYLSTGHIEKPFTEAAQQQIAAEHAAGSVPLERAEGLLERKTDEHELEQGVPGMNG
jgi:hypothetical protein